MKKERKIPLAVKILIPVAVILILAVWAILFVQAKLNQISRVDEESVEKVDPSQEDFEIDEELAQEIAENKVDALDPDEVQWNNADIDVMQDKDVSNILLIGQDRREGQGRQRSDSMIICSINKKSKKIILSSVMRDLYVPIPGYSDNRINAAYQFGGMPLLDQVMEESLGIHIDGNIEVDFEGFISAMTEVGNLDIELYQAEADHLNNGNGWNLKEGVNSMTPEQVLAYSRIRYVGHSDWERTDRQRRVLTAADFQNWNILECHGLEPVDPGPFCQAHAASLALAALEILGTAPERGTVSLWAPRSSPALLRAAEALCPRVRLLTVDVPGEREVLAAWLWREFGAAALDPAAAPTADAALWFADGGGAGRAVLRLYGPAPDLAGLAFTPPSGVAASGLDPLPAMALLWEAGRLDGEKIAVSSNHHT